jgi:hypothetical protein
MGIFIDFVRRLTGVENPRNRRGVVFKKPLVWLTSCTPANRGTYMERQSLTVRSLNSTLSSVQELVCDAQDWLSDRRLGSKFPPIASTDETKGVLRHASLCCCGLTPFIETSEVFGIIGGEVFDLKKYPFRVESGPTGEAATWWVLLYRS